MSRGAAHAPVAVVGAGPYGLATAAHLAARGVPIRVFGEPMDSWRSRMPVGMYLKSTPRASSISDPVGAHSLERFRAAEGRASGGDRHPVPLEEFVRYGLWFQDRSVPDLDRTPIRSIDLDGPGGAPGSADGHPSGGNGAEHSSSNGGTGTGRGFRLTLASGETFTSPAVVMATGLVPFAHTPKALAELVGNGLASHPADHADLSRFSGQRVAVVGAGQSALESAALLHEAGAVPVVLARGEQVLFGDPPTTDVPEQEPLGRRLVKPPTPLGPGWSLRAFSSLAGVYRGLPVGARDHFLRTVLGPSGAWWLRDRVEGRVEVRTGRSLHSVEQAGGGVRLVLANRNGGTEVLEADHVLSATGYRVDVDRMDLLSPRLRAAVRRTGTAPRLSAGLESSVPGLYFTGLAAAPTFGPLLRFVCGTGFAARRVSGAVAAAG
jgi:thioredoxin reductase